MADDAENTAEPNNPFEIHLVFVGRIGEVELAAGTLAISFINVTGPSLYVGLGSAVETLGSQAFGAKNFRYGWCLYCREGYGF
ncbi:hypothetical protein OS493_005314 [Desmophyllum pertusum]|uniref:Uncharacterized protein n=1 Tax=Desmophyllum pertusum TaxID=174260 RepID=A0A9X0CVJ3_9CNID|nr:hypothetical protein OS493_005314 [Desmophyllum pertusum]